MKSALNPKQVRHQNRRARQKAKKQSFNLSGDNAMETTNTTNNQEQTNSNDVVDITVAVDAKPIQPTESTEPTVQLSPEKQELLDKVNAIMAELPEPVQVAMKSGDIDFDSLNEIEQLRVRQIFDVSLQPIAKEIFKPLIKDGNPDTLDGLVNEFINLSITSIRKQMSQADRKQAIIQHLDFIFAMLPPVSVEKAQQGIDMILANMDVKVNASELKTFQSPAVSNAEVREETSWVTGSNMFIGGAVIGTIFNMLTQGVTVTNGIVGMATAGIGWVAKDKINEMVEDSTVKLVGAGVAGAGITVAGTMALDAIRAKLRDGSGVSQEA